MRDPITITMMNTILQVSFRKRKILKLDIVDVDKMFQGGRTWWPFVGGKNGHENFRQMRIYNFCDKCVIFAQNRKIANSAQ